MGVHGLWELLAPVGRRVSAETLSGKKLAIDASIWVIQFMKAMRDEKGDMVRNAHVLGFFRRICKLLYLRTKPVFVFDGGTPALKRRTVIARRRQRENAQAKIRKTAEKLLLNHLKETKLKELAADLQRQREENDIKGKRPVLQEPDNEPEAYKRNGDVGSSVDQGKIDEMLAASLAAEENEDLDVEDEDEEMMMIPEMHEKVDSAVLAALPPSMQLDLLVQMRERLMAENRQRYQKVKKAPSQFSELQIEAYLKKVAFRREIDGVQKSAAGRGIGGVQTSRIASEANREFIFSSSFTGDKQVLASGGQNILISDQPPTQPVASSTIAPGAAFATRTTGDVTVPNVPDSGGSFDGIETYLDENGRFRVSRVRALGIRMTRDLQRNLDLMKEADRGKEVNQGENYSGSILNPEATEGDDSRNSDYFDNINEHSVVNSIPIEISFEDATGLESTSDDGDFFARLVAGDRVMDFPVDKSASVKDTSVSSSDCEWEEGAVGDKKVEQRSEEGVSSEVEFEWEEGFQDTRSASTCLEESQRTVPKGVQEEEADLQEAIRRSLEDTSQSKSSHGIHEDYLSGEGREISHEDVASASGKEGSVAESLASFSSKIFGGSANISIELSAASIELNPKQNKQRPNQDADGNGNFIGEQSGITDTLPEEEASLLTAENKPDNVFNGVKNKIPVNEHAETCIEVKDDTSLGTPVNLSVVDLPHTKLLVSSAPDAHDVLQAASDDNSTQLQNASAQESICIDAVKLVAEEKLDRNVSVEMETFEESTSFVDANKEHEIIKEYVEEELYMLRKESEQLENKQRALERNAESVSSEMFAECQELLQMFGLPYIVAPMEAEAQCAFLELSNLVDGVVTDDADALLFGARSIYKNIFDDRKYVETYFMKDIETELGLNREKLINMALLLGSDYTEGISGIGIVNAVEVVNAFPDKDGLREFREWIESPDPSILGKVVAKGLRQSRKKASKGGENIQSHSDDQTQLHSAENEKQIFMEKHRNVSKNWHIPSSFPSEAVISAYASPQVDNSTELFSWGKPDLSALRKLCFEKFGWGGSKADELLLPVLKEYNKNETQLRLEAFYTFNERFSKIRSKRIMNAVKGITGKVTPELVDVTAVPQQSGRRNKRKVSIVEDEDVADGTGEQSAAESSIARRKATRGSGGRSKRQPSSRNEEEKELRRSARPRKTVRYDDSVIDDKESIDEGSPMKSSSRSRAATATSAGSEAYTCQDSDLERNADPFPTQGSSPGEYLQFGGGFCLNENEETGGSDLPKPGHSLRMNPGETNSYDLVVESDGEIRNNHVAQPVIISNPLRAMPNLRRKKKT